MAALLTVFVKINMLGKLKMKASISWIGYKLSITKTCAMEILYFFNSTQDIFEDTTVVVAKVTLRWFKNPKTIINGHDDDLHKLDRSLQSFLKQASPQNVYDTNYHVAIHMLTRAFVAYKKGLGKYVDFYDTSNCAFEFFFQHWVHYQMHEWHTRY